MFLCKKTDKLLATKSSAVTRSVVKVPVGSNAYLRICVFSKEITALVPLWYGLKTDNPRLLALYRIHERRKSYHRAHHLHTYVLSYDNVPSLIIKMLL